MRTRWRAGRKGPGRVGTCGLALAHVVVLSQEGTWMCSSFLTAVAAARLRRWVEFKFQLPSWHHVTRPHAADEDRDSGGLGLSGEWLRGGFDNWLRVDRMCL